MVRNNPRARFSVLRARHEISVSNTRVYLDELYSSILRGTSRDEYLFLQSVFLIPWLLAGRSWCRVRPAPLNQSESLSLKSNSQSPRGSPRVCRASSD